MSRAFPKDLSCADYSSSIFRKKVGLQLTSENLERDSVLGHEDRLAANYCRSTGPRQQNTDAQGEPKHN